MGTTTGKAGRPRIGRAELRARVTHEVVDEIDRWAEAQKDRPTRAEAVRRLVELALSRELAEINR